MSNPILINSTRCHGCGKCAGVCPNKALSMREVTASEIESADFFSKMRIKKHPNRVYMAHPENCTRCGRCSRECSHRCIKIAEAIS